MYAIIYELTTPVLAPPLFFEWTPLLLCNYRIVICVLRVKLLGCLVAHFDLFDVILHFPHSKSKRSNSIEQCFSTYLVYGPVNFQNKFCGPVDLKNQPKMT